jgi:hypothetical protein
MLTSILTILPSIMILFFFTFGLNQRLVWRMEWLTLLPVRGRFPVIAHTLLINTPLDLKAIFYTMIQPETQAIMGS